MSPDQSEWVILSDMDKTDAGSQDDMNTNKSEDSPNSTNTNNSEDSSDSMNTNNMEDSSNSMDNNNSEDSQDADKEINMLSGGPYCFNADQHFWPTYSWDEPSEDSNMLEYTVTSTDFGMRTMLCYNLVIVGLAAVCLYFY
jgi:hypothetical protein